MMKQTLCLTGRMNAKAIQRGAQVDQPRSVQAQSNDGRASRRRKADDLCRIITPCEMLSPLLPSRVKQRGRVFCYGINPGLKCAFETVTSQAGQGEICFLRRAASGFGNDMLNGERVGVKPGQAATILALAFGTLPYETLERGWNIGL